MLVKTTAGAQTDPTGAVRRVGSFLDTLSQNWRIANAAQWTMRAMAGGADPGFAGGDAFNSSIAGATIVRFAGYKMAHASVVSGSGVLQLFYNNAIPLQSNSIPAASLQLPENAQYYEYSFVIAVPAGGYNDTADNGFLGIACAPARMGAGSWGGTQSPAASGLAVLAPSFGITSVLGLWHWYVRQAFTNAGPAPLDAFVDISTLLPPNGTAFRVTFRFFPGSGSNPVVVQMLVNGELVVATTMGAGPGPGGLGTPVGMCNTNENNQSADGVVAIPYINSVTANSADLYIGDMSFVCGINDPSTPTI
jgi:hypothetical protein